ncbi:hypothetical protein N0V84_011966 [Fusarium piperis]|uniref:Aminoglycoside phosphotransferase domain-containing protein n=1 Tax=Fusarium piperis TaxID=1435070 RepID=A0A9W8TDH6_9HYPO|nr:hypothetical protein N0V84_011966 [Fusarium piperis]
MSSTYNNAIGIPYILMSKAAGYPLAKYDWRPRTHQFSDPNGTSTASRILTKEEKERIMRQLGCFARQLFGLRFPTIGSLIESDEGYRIDECLSPGHILQDRETIEELPRGPFRNEADYYSSLATALHLHAEQLPMGHHVLRAPVPVPEEYPNFTKYYTATDRWNDFVTLGGMVDSSINRLQYCLVSHLLQDSIIPRMVCPVSQSAPGFPLHHHDISLQNLFVDDDLNITCVIDWAFSSTVPPAQLLAPPGLPHPKDLVSDLSLIGAFRSGFEGENRKIGEYAVESCHWEVSQMIARFIRLVNLDALQDYNHLEALYVLAQGSVTPGDDGNGTNSLPDILTAQVMARDALLLADKLAADDEPESEICRREKEYFDAVGAQRLALARKVTIAAKMNPGFVADGRLWRWVDAIMECYDSTESDGLEELSTSKHVTSGLGVGKGSNGLLVTRSEDFEKDIDERIEATRSTDTYHCLSAMSHDSCSGEKPRRSFANARELSRSLTNERYDICEDTMMADSSYSISVSTVEGLVARRLGISGQVCDLGGQDQR